MDVPNIRATLRNLAWYHYAAISLLVAYSGFYLWLLNH